MSDLTTTYLGLHLRSPLVASPSPMCEDLDNLRRMEDAGAGAVVLHSLFEEQIEMDSHYLDHHLDYGSESFAESLTYFPEYANLDLGPERYLDHVARAKNAVDIPVIASLNGVSKGGWTVYAKRMDEAGADALELNVYFIPTDPEMSSVEVERRYTELVEEVRASVGLPLAVKIGPQFTAPAHMARSLEMAGADALVLFNRF